jgi:hypothetical protein
MNAYRRFCTAIVVVISCTAARLGCAVTLISTDDPTFNTTEPTGNLANSGWQYEATFGPFLATAVGPHHFLTVQHIGMPASTLVYQGATYTIVGSQDDPGSDLRLLEVAEAAPTYAPLYLRSDETGRDLIVIGRGTQRGDPVYVSGQLAGWQWGLGDQAQRWGENQVTRTNGVFLYATFDQNGNPNEAHLSSGDSGGAAFINDGGTWKLAGIHYGVDGPFSDVAGGPTFYATLFDERGLFDSTAGRVIAGSAPVPSGFYSIRISTELSWIWGIVFPGTPVPFPTPTPAPTPVPTPSTVAQMLQPAPGSALASSVTTFSWTADRTGGYSLLVGTSVGTSNIYNSGRLGVRSISVANIPTDGSTIYVRLRSLVSRGRWQYRDYSYASYGFNPGGTPTPTPSATALPQSTPAPSATPTPTPRPRISPPDRN